MRVFFTAVCVALVSMATAASANVVTFTIDSSQSSLTLSLYTLDGAPISSAQTPGSDTTSLSGTVNVDLTGTTIEFLPTADTQFALQAVPQAPLPDGAAGTAPAQIGLNLDLTGIASGVVAARNYLGDATSGPIPRVGNTFDASQLTLNLVTGNTAYNLTVLGSPVSGSFDNNNATPNDLTGGTLDFAGGVYTLRVPLHVGGEARVQGVTVQDLYAGEIVATATVPEPSALALGLWGVGGWGLLAIRKRIRRKSAQANR